MATVPIRPLADKVLVRADDPSLVTAGGILLPDVTVDRERPRQGTVVAVGPGTLNPRTGDYTPLDVKPGDRVFMSSRTWYFDFDDVKDQNPALAGHVIVREQDLVAVVEDGSYAA